MACSGCGKKKKKTDTMKATDRLNWKQAKPKK